ncbi:MAG: 23S rRNA (adenine2503-C2)-methyltransferase [Paracoccaceae bacterium]
MQSDVSLFDSGAMEALRREAQLDPQRVRVLRNDLLKKFVADEAALSRFPAAERVACHSLELVQAVDSQIDGATKLLFRTTSGMLIESVLLRIATGRSTLCVSSQVGCAAACAFCATGKMGIAQSLRPEEILDQVLQAGQRLAAEGRRLDNVVFMGMGEPFHNEATLHAVLEALTSPKMFDRSPKSLLVSTVGVPDAMERCAERFPQVSLALSLHSAVQAKREGLIPLAKKFSLDELHGTLRRINERQRQAVMIEYLMLRDVNDSHEDARALIDWVKGLTVHINLIPYNPIDDAPDLLATERQAIGSFADTLKAAGLKTTIRYSLGNDIAAACGQLVRMENRRRAIEAGRE